MQCSRCAGSGMVEIKMKIAGEDVVFRQCGRCEAKSWLTIDGPLSLSRVLEMAKVNR
jgi:excinuclease UvrABC ATPase subunit